MTGIDRGQLKQDEPVSFTGEANVQHLIDTMRKRLCFHASKETRELAEDLKWTITVDSPEIGNVLVPNCVYRCGCPENSKCNFWQIFCNTCNLKYNVHVQSLSIQERYDYYNKYYVDSRFKKEE